MKTKRAIESLLIVTWWMFYPATLFSCGLSTQQTVNQSVNVGASPQPTSPSPSGQIPLPLDIQAITQVIVNYIQFLNNKDLQNSLSTLTPDSPLREWVQQNLSREPRHDLSNDVRVIQQVNDGAQALTVESIGGIQQKKMTYTLKKLNGQWKIMNALESA